MEALRSTKEITDYLKEHHIKPSLIRMKVMQYLISTGEHPTVELIFRNISKDIPTLSKTSIYNTLKTFTAAKVAREVIIEENETRYDADTGRHAHFKCMRCGSLQDIGLGCVSCASSGKMKDNRVLDEHIYMAGICADCVKKEGAAKDGKKIKAGS
jgi:Fur family peroxide stress response transcriptional regulator